MKEAKISESNTPIPAALPTTFFTVTSLLGYKFIPRIRDLPSKRLYVFDPGSIPAELKGLIGGKVREGTIVANWPDILRCAATMVAGTMPPSQLLKKFASHSRRDCPSGNRTG